MGSNPIDSAWNVYIFREGKSAVSADELVDQLSSGLLAFGKGGSQSRRTELIDLLLRAGELECALRDLDFPHARVAEEVTVALADALVADVPLEIGHLLRRLRLMVAHEDVELAAPEGFAYYSLHPLDFADLVQRIEPAARHAAIIGIRSIGTTLSAVVQSALRNDGVQAERITVRPTGHPYDRQTSFSAQQLNWISRMSSRGSQFFVVDEGPGMSGSSFLSVGDALLAAGVPCGAIRFLCSRNPDPALLTAPNGHKRWCSFRSDYTQLTRHLPAKAKEYVAGGIWRARASADETAWPASWTQMERSKFLSADGRLLYKFEGFGRFGQAVYQRAMVVAEAGFGPMPEAREEGFGVYPVVTGRYLTEADANESVLQRIAQYCAFRAERITSSVNRTPDLETMLRFNVHQEFGVELPQESGRLTIERPVIADGRMLPHKWIESAGQLLKIDSASHGDDHFFPGPTDIAWDLAGTIVEWRLEGRSAACFVDCYRRQTGDDPAERLPAYLVAYSIFRTAYCKMASAAMNGSYEYERLVRDYRRYREQAAGYLNEMLECGVSRLIRWNVAS